MFSVFVTVNVKAEFVDEFIAASLDDAQGSVRDEPGCLRFDINQDKSTPTRFYLYEVYQDEAAFQAHLATEHFEAWIATVEPMLDGELQKLTMQTVFPSESGWTTQKPSLLAW